MNMTVKEKEEIARLNERIAHVTKECDNAIDSSHRLPINLVLEARHNKLEIQIIEIQALIRQMKGKGYGFEEIVPVRMRLQYLIGRAKEIGKTNALLKQISQTSVKLEVTVL